jgi:hypothetical protein
MLVTLKNVWCTECTIGLVQAKIRIEQLNTGFGLVIRFIGLLQTVTTIHYCMHEVFSVCCVFTGRCLVMAPNAVKSSASMSHGSSPCWLAPVSH